jgi:8-oxo-dGTP pyrophosphatase MutT (NUDIX family)
MVFMVRCISKTYAIGIIPIDKDGYTYLVGQYRFALERIIAGKFQKAAVLCNDDILTSAKRELQEEVGFFAQKWTKIAELNTSNSVTDEVGIIFVAQDLEQTNTAHEETEELQIKKIHLSDAIDWAMNGKIKDAIALIGLLKLKILIDNKTIII